MEKRQSTLQETSEGAATFVPCRFRVFLDSHTFPTEHQLILHRVHGTAIMAYYTQFHTPRLPNRGPDSACHPFMYGYRCSTWSSRHSRSVRRICPCRFTLTLSLTSSAACAATEGGMAQAHAHARQPQIAPSCHVRARTKPAHDTIPIRRVCQCRGNESTSSSAPPPRHLLLGTSSSAPPPQPLLLGTST